MVEIVGDPGRPLLIRTDSSIPVVVVDTEVLGRPLHAQILILSVVLCRSSRQL